MLQTNHGMSIPALVPPRFEEPNYGMNTSSPRPPPFSMCQPHASNSLVPSARVLQEVLYSNEMNYPSYMPDMPNNQSLPLPWMSSWHQRQNLPYLGHPRPGKSIVLLFYLITNERVLRKPVLSWSNALLRETPWFHLTRFKNLSIHLNSKCSLIVVVVFIYVFIKLLWVFA